MAANTSTLKFLPAIFQTDTNEKFLNATLDQLTSEADLRRVNGYIGRKFAPTYKTADNYISEPTAARQNYQLEPSVVVQNKQENTVNLFSTYIDLIQQVATLGGNTSDHSRMFSNESYTFDGLFDFDKFGNYNNYYWLPDGPDAVDVYAGTVDTEETFVVARNLAANGYNFSGKGTGANPVLTLARGGTYKFNLGQQGNRFWIQTEPGVSGTKVLQSNVSTRNIYGVASNGASVGQIVFTVPRKTAQDSFSQLTLAATVDIATPFGYTQIQHQLLSVLLQTYPTVFDGISTELNKKTLIFTNSEIDDLKWETPGVFDKSDEPFDFVAYDPGDVVSTTDRKGVWTIDLQPSENGDYLVVLVPTKEVEINQRVYVSSGINNANQQYWLERTGSYSIVPENTAALDRLYYQDGTDPNLFGLIQIVEAEGYSIDVASNIIGQKSYTSPNGVIFTNGLKIQFDDTVTDSIYSNNEYYVEGVGTSIQLIKVTDLVTPEAYAVDGLTVPDYITINRDSIDHNAWSRSNRWFHIDVIQATADYNNTVASPDQAYRAQRPIIEFEGHLQLFDAGRVAKQPVDLLIDDGTITDAMNQLEGTLVTAAPTSVLLEVENTDSTYGIIDIYAAGIGYELGDILTVTGTISATAWSAGATATSGVYYSYNNNLYLATTSGTFSTELPVHTGGTKSNGTVSLLYAGANATLKVTEISETGGVLKLTVSSGGAYAIPVVSGIVLTGGTGTGARANLTYRLQSINFESYGSGFFYDAQPTVTIDSTFPWAAGATAEQFKYYSYLDTIEDESVAIDFKSLSAGQTVTVAGLTFTANADTTAANVAVIFSNLTPSSNIANVTSSTGSLTGNLVGFSSGEASAGTTTFTSSTFNQNVTDIVTSTTGTETSTITFSNLNIGQTVTVAGLTFTSTGNTTAANVAVIFSNLTPSSNIANVTSSTGSLTGNLVGFSSSTANITFANVVFTSTTVNSNVTNIVTTTSTETSTVTFSDLQTGNVVTVAGLTFTANADTTAANVAVIFSNLTPSSNIANVTSSTGSLTGNIVGFSSGSTSTANVVFTSTTVSSNVADIVISTTGLTPLTITTIQGVDPLTITTVQGVDPLGIYKIDGGGTSKPITYYYKATSNGTFSTTAPTHTAGTTLNGNVSLQFMGVVNTPTWQAPYTWSTWTASGTAISNNYYTYGNKYYLATGAGTFGSTAPTHTSGSVTSGTVPLLYKGKILNLDTNGTALTLPGIETVTLNKSRVYSLTFASKGTGYTAVPKVTLSSPTTMPSVRAVFADDFDPSVKNSIFVISAVDTTGGNASDTKVHLTLADDYEVLEGNCLNVTGGDNAGYNFWYTGSMWNKGQLKTSVNQSPLFDIIDANGIGLGDIAYYPVSSFAGTAIFSYKIGTGSADRVLGFPLSYRNFNSIGDIQFTNNFDSETITYASGASTVSVPVNYNFLKQNRNIGTYDNRNIWTKNIEDTKQYQIFSFAYTTSNYFPVDILPEEETAIPYTKVFVNNHLLKSTDYSYTLVGSRQTVRVDYTLLKENDKVDILIYSKSVSKTGYYEIPNSLDYNSKNANFSSLTLGQIRSHITKIKENTKLAVDIGSTFSGLRDIRYKGNGGNIVQQSAPAMYSNIFLTDKNLNFAQSIDYSAREYTRFKNKFLELATKLDISNVTDIAAIVDAILKNINNIKNKTFPWYYSDMVPYGDNANVINYSIINPLTKQYEITQVFEDTKLSNLAVLVYLNGVQLVNGIDFSFLQDRSAILLGNTITLTVADKLKIVEYNDTDGSFIPETPSKLGLYPKFVPQRFVDTSYITPVEVIQGHDGSITPIFNDIRDNLLLELEKRIYNNIKIDYDTHIFDLYDHLPGKFRKTDYSLTEFNQLLSNKFLRWVGDNRVDYSTNNYFVSGNPWTWNYKKFKDRVNGATLPGTWRAIFSHFFDTYRPNTHPWEMLGFGEKPTWWEERYGAAPYTGGNKLLWDDLEIGYIHAGPTAGIDTRFARPGLSQVIPVDEYGDLLSPEKWATSTFDSLKANSSYSVGDQGPVEFAWRTSSYFPYALQYALALAKPGYYFGSLINVDRYYRNTTIDQLVNTESRQRITPTTVVINGDTSSGTAVRSAGYLNWIRDYVLSVGMNPTTEIRTYLDTVNVQLGYKVGGYTDKNFIQLLAEQGSPTNTSNSIVIPTENYSINLNSSTPIRKAVYSAVVVERTENGFTVNGYNQNSPFFTIIPSMANNNFYIVEVLKRRGVIYKDYQNIKLTVPYGFEFNTEQEVVDFLISYGRFLVAQGFKFDTQDDNLGETRNWVLSSKEFLNWAQQGWKSGSIIVLSPVYNELINVQPDGVISVIDNTPNGTKLLDQNFDFIKNTQFTESRIGNKFTLKSLSNQTICLADLTVVQYEHAILFDNVTVFNDILYVPELGNRQFRLKLVGSKTGSWSGTLSPPGFVYNSTLVDAWQPGVDYLLGSIVQYKNLYYTALTNIVADSEFVQDKQWRQINSGDIKTGLLPNFTHSAKRLQQVYDVDNLPSDMTLEGFGTSLIGFRKRGYLSNFGLDETSQVKFFQGFIKEKGTLNAITGLTNAKVNEWSSGIDIYEEWALRVGEYGSLTTDQIVEVELDETVITANPTAIQFIDSGEIEPLSDVVSFHPIDLYKAPAGFTKNLFFNRDGATTTINDIQTAGYPSLIDVDETLFSFTKYNELDKVIAKIGPGYYIWVAKDYANEWNVYRVTETQINVVNLSYNIDNLMTVEFTDAPGLVRGDIFAIKSFDSRLDGFYQVYTVSETRKVQVAIVNDGTSVSTGVDNSRFSTIKELKNINGYGIYYKLQSARLSSLVEANGIIPPNGWEAGDKLWVDSADIDGNWAVFNKVDAWNSNSELLTDEAASINGQFGTTISSNKLANNFFVGSPKYSNIDGSTGIVKTFSRTGTTVRQTSKFDARSNLAGNFGQTITASDYTVAIGAPLSNSTRGYVYIQNLATAELQILTSNTAAVGDYFGNAIAIADDNDWMYIGAPGVNAVYIYNYQDDVTTKSNTITYGSADTVGTTYTTVYTPVSKYALSISDQYKNYVVDVDFTLSGNVINFVNPPTVLDTKISVLQSKYYENIGTVPLPSDVVAGDMFGDAVATTDDGKTLIVGAPGQNSGAGAVYIFRRFEESYNSNLDNIYDSAKNFGTYTKVYVNGSIQSSSAYTITNNTRLSFDSPLLLGQVVLVVGTDWVQVQKITEPSAGAGNQFGSSIAIDHILGSTFYVSAPNTLQTTGESGAVYRYSDTAKILGSITASLNPEYIKRSIANGGDTFDSNIGLYINGYYVSLSSAITTFDDNSTDPATTYGGYANPTTCVSLINAAKIPLVSATTTADGFFTISTTNKVANNKLSVVTNGSNLFDLIGITPYGLDQVIAHPAGSLGFGFASRIKYSPETATLLISSIEDDVYYESEVDTGKTTFDQRSTRVIDIVKSSGSVFVYELLSDTNTAVTNTGTMSYVQHIKSTGLGSNDQFGIGLDINKDLILVGAPGDDSIAVNAGAVHVYTNISQVQSWNKTRAQEAKVDLDNINRFFIYDKTTGLIRATLDYIDPVKGKILGIAEQDLDYKTALDPAVYNAGNRSGIANNSGYHWNEQQVGKLWWNLNDLRYIDYEQGDLIYRTNNWGKLFPSSTVQVCEWIKSKFPPSQYVTNGGDGTPLYTNAYCVVTTVIGGVITPEYYYWVTDKQSAAAGKHYSVSILSNIIENPQLQGIPYGFMSKNNAIGLVNVQNYLNAVDSVLHIDYQKFYNDNSVHTEYELVNEGQPNIQLPTRIIDKLIDSLSGIDSIGQVVPDPTLTESNKIGLSTRPVQTLVIDRSMAVENFVKYVNGVLIKYPIVYQYSLLGIEKVDPIPPGTEYDKVVTTVEDIGYIDTRASIANALPIGYRVLVTSDSSNSGLWTIYTLDSDRVFVISRIQYYNTALYWDKVDWYAEDYDPTGRITYTVTAYKDIATLTLASGDVVRVNYDDNGQFSIYRTNTDLTLERVGIENGTIQLKSTLYNLAAGQMGWDEDRFDTVRFDQTPSIEIRNILIALRDDIFIDSLGAEFNKLFFIIVNYILQEQKSVDWIFKTSFISIFHNLRELSQPPSFVLDNQEYYLDYINEVKPYRTIVREYVVDYTGSDTVGSNVTDFDLPSLYNKTLGKYRPPSGELSGDTTLINITPEYQYWKQYHTYTIDTIEISSPGTGYLSLTDATGTIVSPSVIITGGGGTGATATAATWGNGAIKSITVTNSGTGYTSRPEVRINGTGTGGLAAARIINRTARQFDSVLKFDRTAYDSNVSLWASANSYVSGSVVAYNGQAYRASANVSASANFDYDTFELLTGAEVGNANDRVIAYIASNQVDNLDTTTALGSEVARSRNNKYWLTQYFTGIEYPGVQVQGLKFDANVADQALLDTVIQSRYVDTGLGTRPEDINIDGGAYIDYYSSHAPEELLPGVVHESVDISVFTAEVYGNLVVNPGGAITAYREFLDIGGGHDYLRISGLATAYLVGNLSTTATSITVNDSSLLSTPDLIRAIPGELFISGEKITYWNNNTATNTLTNIRRGVGGTANQAHLSGTIVYDAGTTQKIPGLNARTALISSNSSFSSNSSINYWRANSSSSTFTTVDNVTYKLTLNGNITANCGDYITQLNSNANAVVRGNVTSAKSIAVTFLTGNVTTANANCILQVNGVSSVVAPNAISILGSVNAVGNVTITAPTVAGFTTNVEIYQDTTAWYDYDALLLGIPGTTGLQNSSTASAIFLGLGATALVTDITAYYSTEDDPATVNTIMITENSQILTQE